MSQLEALPGWVWSVLEAKWEEGFSHLEAFAKGEGHANVPRTFKTEEDRYGLGAWVSSKRSVKDDLSPDRIAQLETVPGWSWSVLEAQWEEGFGHLKTFAEREGHARVPTKFKTTEEGYKLGSWISNNRTKKAKLAPERKARLESLPGWVWKAQ